MQEQQRKSELNEMIDYLNKFGKILLEQHNIERALLLMGENKSGKTALLYYLTGKELMHKKNQMDVYVLEPSSLFQQAEVGTDFTSTTIIPNIYLHQPQSLSLIDLPGYSSNRPFFQFLKLYIFTKIMERVESAHICQLVSQQEFDASHLLKQLEKICLFFQPNFIRSDQCLSFVLTKAEDQDMLERFQQTMEEIKGESQAQHIQEQLDHFLHRNTYLFKNEQPNIDQGLQLLTTITKENKFYPIHKSHNNLLAPGFHRCIISQVQQQQFNLFLLSISKQWTAAASTLVALSSEMTQFQFSSILSEAIGQREDEFKKTKKDYIEKYTAKLCIHELNEMKAFSTLENAPQNIERLHQIYLREKTSNSKEQQLLLFISHMISVLTVSMDNQKTIWTKISPSFVETVRLLFQELSQIFNIFITFAAEGFMPVATLISQNELLINQIQKLYRFWDENSQKIVKLPLYQKMIENKGIQQKYRIVKKPVYRSISNQQISTLVASLKPTQNKSPQILQQIPQEKEIILNFTVQDINSLQNNSLFLKFLLPWLQKKNVDQPEITHAVVHKIISILTRYSCHEEAIMFAMAAQNHNEVERLVQQAVFYCQASPQFVRQILIKYFKHFAQASTKKINLQLCLNYLAASEEFFEEKTSFYVENLRQLAALKQNIETSSQSYEKYPPLIFDYIRPILQSQAFYCQLLASKQQMFLQSSAKSLFQLPAIGKMMN